MYTLERLKFGLQTSCVVACAIGIVIEYHYEADLGFVCLSVGSLAFAISTKINHRKKIHKDDQ